uniref:Bro-k n=1 Tax=Lymantria dispar multicapsid nuclear polyhedrosis virus TaxID=10449 RepID=A0A0D3QWF8_NPVLD|nr:bro-k [Lymantria dispar multiple nucleopolyhedrovirus]AQQ80129.1 bro-k [Lymantria dispar multiple nucleopolyhedrovirus]
MALQRFEFPMSADGDDVKFECWGVVMPDGGVAVKLKELALFLGYADVKMSYKHVPDEWKITWKNLQNKLASKRHQLVAPPTTPANWHPETLFVLEPGVYALMARSTKPMAKERMKYVYETILPTIRKTGKFEMSKTSDVINYDARMAEMKVELLEEKMKHQSTVVCLAEKERAIVEIKLEHERQLAEFKEREYEMRLAMQRLSEAANMTMTQFAVNALLAKDNIEENQQMRKTLVEVSDRVVPALSDRPHKEEYITGYERTVNGKRRIRMCRSQLNEIEQQDRTMQRYRDETSGGRDTRNKKAKTARSKRYAWLRDSEKFLQLKCPNPVAVWLKVRAERPLVFYGLRYTNKLKTEMEVLDERELREKYAKDAAMCERNRPIHAKLIEEFRKLGLEDETDCVARCLTSGAEAKERINSIVERIVKNASEELAPSMPQRNHDNAGDAYTTEQVVHAMHNCKNYFVEKMFNVNFNFYAAAPPPSVAPPPVEYSDKSKCN